MNAPAATPSTVPGLEFFVLARRSCLPAGSYEFPTFEVGPFPQDLPCELRHMALDVNGREVCLGVTATGCYAEVTPLRRLFAVEPIKLHPDEPPEVVEVWV